MTLLTCCCMAAAWLLMLVRNNPADDPVQRAADHASEAVERVEKRPARRCRGLTRVLAECALEKDGVCAPPHELEAALRRAEFYLGRRWRFFLRRA